MPRKRSPGHWYGVYVVAYVDEATKAKVERSFSRAALAVSL